MLLELTSADLWFVVTRKGLVHVTDSSDPVRRDRTLCGVLAAPTMRWLETREEDPDKICTRCQDSLRSEARWGAWGIGGRLGRWKLYGADKTATTKEAT